MVLIFGRLVVTLFLLVALVLSMTGFAGSVLAFLTALIYGWATGFQTMTSHVLLILFILTATAETIEILSGTIGAKTFQASKQAVWGSMIGLCCRRRVCCRSNGSQSHFPLRCRRPHRKTWRDHLEINYHDHNGSHYFCPSFSLISAFADMRISG